MSGFERGIFVTGIDTEVGKTVVAGGLLSALGSRGLYWKVVQTGTLIADDTEEIRRLTQLGKDCFAQPLYRFPDPVSPHLAMERWKKSLSLETIEVHFSQMDRPCVVEGAGGVLTPVTSDFQFRDVIRVLDLPVIVVASDRLGAINQTLLTLEALKGCAVAGVVWTRYTGQFGNAEAVEKMSGVECLAKLPENADARGRLSAVAGESRLRELVGLGTAPEI